MTEVDAIRGEVERFGLLNELVEEFSMERRLPDDVDASQLARALGVSNHWANTLLTKKVDAGELVKVEVRDDRTGRKIPVYRKAA